MSLAAPSLESIPRVGELAALAAALIWSVTICVYRTQATALPAATVNLFKNCVAFLCLGALAWLTAAPWPTDRTHLTMLALSGLVGLVVSDTSMFAALRRLGAQRTAAIQCLGPPLAALLGWFYLEESLKPYALAGMALTVCAIAGVILFGPRDHIRLGPDWSLGVALAVVSAAAQATGLVLARRAFQHTEVATGTMVRLAPAILALALFSSFQGKAAKWNVLFDSRRRVAMLLAAAFFGGFFGLYLLSAATKHADAGLVATVSSTYPIWLIPVAYFGLKERVTVGQVLCTLAAVAGIGLIFLD